MKRMLKKTGIDISKIHADFGNVRRQRIEDPTIIFNLKLDAEL